MRNIDVKEVETAVSNLCIQSCCHLPEEVFATLQAATNTEESPLGKEIIEITKKYIEIQKRRGKVFELDKSRFDYIEL